MNEFIPKLKQLLSEFDYENCTKSCDKCELGKVLIEIDCAGWYSQYNACDLLDKIKDSLHIE